MRLPLTILGLSVAAIPVGSQLAWLIANQWTQVWRLPVILVSAALLAALAVWAARRWHGGRTERDAALTALCVATWPLLLGWTMPLVRLVYTQGPHPSLVAGLGAALTAWTLGMLALRHHPRLLALPIVVLLYLVLSLHLAGLATGLGRGTGTQEGRPPAPLPARPTTVEELQRWPAAYEAHLNDTFRGRLALINASSAIDLLVLHRNSDPGSVIVGTDRWLFRGNRERRSDYAGRWSMDPLLRPNLTASLIQRRSTLEAAGIRYLLVFAPDKASTYPELMPVADRPVAGPHKLDQILAVVQEAGIEHLDLRPVLAASPLKAAGDLYYRSDTHWNQRGAYAASEAIAAALRPRHAPGALPWADLITTSRPIGGGDLARFLGDPTLFAEAAPQLVPAAGWRHRAVPVQYTGLGRSPVAEWPEGMDFISATEVVDATLPSAVIVHDSFGIALRPFLAERFRRCVFAWSHVVSREIVAAERPDVVIQIRAEEYSELLAKPDVERFDTDPR